VAVAVEAVEAAAVEAVEAVAVAVEAVAVEAAARLQGRYMTRFSYPHRTTSMDPTYAAREP
jgi:hypothetical protein